ncbi:MAG: hypothetical protein KDA44_16900 [Planctomycetales bacterium]|nr:hypothetical protein [Planctomycetales bacterium]
MTCPDAKTWDLLSMNLLKDPQAETLRRHARQCEQCRAAWQEAAQRHADLVVAMGEFDRQHDQRREQLMSMLPPSAPPVLKESRRAGWRQRLNKGDFAMILRQHKTRWAAAATLAAASLVVAIILAAGERVAFAVALDNMRQAKTMTCDTVTTVKLTKSSPGVQAPGLEAPHHGTLSMLADGDTRTMLYEVQTPESAAAAENPAGHDGSAAEPAESGSTPAGKPATMRMLYSGDNAYVWAGGTLQVLTSLDASRQPGPQQWLDQLMKFRDEPDRQLDEKMIGGRTAQGFEIAGWKAQYGARPTAGSPASADDQATVRVWVDVEQDLPVRIEISQPLDSPQVTGTVLAVLENIQWNVPLDPAQFQPPSEEELAQAKEIAMPAADEAVFIAFMQQWVDSGKQAAKGVEVLKQKAAEKGEPLPAAVASMMDPGSLNDGYPEKLDAMWLSGAYVGRLTVATMGELLAKQEPLPKDLSADERQRLIQQRSTEAAQATGDAVEGAMLQAMAAAKFYLRLANDGCQPEYFGATVEPGDSDAVLLKWKLDDGRHRVIYGDLHVETVE